MSPKRKKQKKAKARFSGGRISPDPSRNMQKAIKYHESGRLREASKFYQKVLRDYPNHAPSLYLLGKIAHQSGKDDAAVDLIRQAIQYESNPIFYNDLGVSLHRLGKLDEAISSYQKAIELNPRLAATYDCLGTALKDKSELNDSISCYQKAIQLDPSYSQAWFNAGIVLDSLGKTDQSIACYREALRLKPDLDQASANLMFQLQETFDWQELESLCKAVDSSTQKALNNGMKPAEMPLMCLSRYEDCHRDLAIAKSWSSDISARVSALNVQFSFDNRRSAKRPITIGYLSNDFRNHPVAHLISGLFRLHDRDEFQVFCYSYGQDDKSYYRERIRQECDRFVDLNKVSSVESAKQLFSDQIDILIDLTGHTKDNRLEICALRPAPIQVSYLGFPGSTGADFFDYLITDMIVTPQEQVVCYSENLVYLPHCYLVNDKTQAISDKDWQKADFGLPDDSLVFCSFNHAFKIEPIMFDVWMNILRTIPKSVLWLAATNDTARTNLRNEATARNVESNRLIFAEKLPTKEDHLGRLRLADLALDTRIFNGHTTTSDALWAGVPVITLQGSHFASRVTSSMLAAVGLPELITRTLDEYEKLAVRLAGNQGELQIIRKKLERNRLSEPLFDTPRFARNLEKAYKKMWEIFLAGERPHQIKVVEN